jgi:hypothetical protein
MAKSRKLPKGGNQKPFLLLVIVLSVLLRCKASDYPLGIFKLFLAIVLSVLLRCMDSDYTFSIFLPKG